MAGAKRFLRPKSHRVLELLAERPGQLLVMDDLVRRAWPDAFVSDDSLALRISDIRRALGAEGAVLLLSVLRRGDMLVAAGADRATQNLTDRPSTPARARLRAASLVAAAGLLRVTPQEATPA